LGNGDVGAPDFIGAFSISDVLEGDLKPAVGTPYLPHGVWLIPHIDDRACLETDQVVLVDVDAEEPVEAMGTAQPPDDMPLGLSRGTRPQR
jgi:hypothetical protein